MSMKREWIGRWKGRTVVCIASGPSLTPEDCDTVRVAGLPTIVTNTTFRLCPWAEVLFAFDAKWWKHHLPEVKSTFRGACISWSPAAKALGIPSLHAERAWYTPFHNSGASAASLAVVGGADRVILLGYDCKAGPHGQKHWHTDHPAGLGNALSMPKWPIHFKGVARYAAARSVPVLNASRETALTFFPRVVLADVLQPQEALA